MNNKPIFLMYSNHIKESGRPPEYTNENSGDYFGYFENVHGEQWIFSYNRKEKKGELRGGDIGWENPVEVINGQVAGLILDPSERAWLKACWIAAHLYNNLR